MAVLGTGRDADRLAELEKAIGDPDRVATLAVDLTADDGPQRIVDAALRAVGAHRLPGQQRRRRQPQAAARDRRRITGLFPGFDAAGAVPAGPRRDPAHAAGLGDHQRHVDVRRRRRPARRRVLGGQGRADGADHAHRLPVRAAGHPLQRRGARRHAHADGGAPRLEDERFRKINTEMTPHPRLGKVEDIASTVAFLCSDGRQLHQRADDRRRRRLEFDEVPVGLRAERRNGSPVEPVRPARPGRGTVRRPRRGVSR